MDNPENLGVAAHDDYTWNDESGDEEESLRRPAIWISDNGTGFEIRIVVEFTWMRDGNKIDCLVI